MNLPALPATPLAIVRIDAHVFRYPVKVPVRTSFGTMHDRPALFVRVEDRDGAFGWGEASLEGWAEAVDGVFEAFRDRFIGSDPFNIEDIWQVGYRGGFYRGGPVLMSALAGLEQALWDLKGRALGLPAWQMLGGKVRDKVRSYAWIGGDRPHHAEKLLEGVGIVGVVDQHREGLALVDPLHAAADAGDRLQRRFAALGRHALR